MIKFVLPYRRWIKKRMADNKASLYSTVHLEISHWVDKKRIRNDDNPLDITPSRPRKPAVTTLPTRPPVQPYEDPTTYHTGSTTFCEKQIHDNAWQLGQRDSLALYKPLLSIHSCFWSTILLPNNPGINDAEFSQHAVVKTSGEQHCTWAFHHRALIEVPSVLCRETFPLITIPLWDIGSKAIINLCFFTSAK